MLINSIPKYQPIISSNIQEKNTNSKVSFGLNVSWHAQKQMAERAIDINDVIEVVKNGRKYSTVIKDNSRIVNVGNSENGKLPSHCLIVVTDETGDEIITTHRVNSEEWIVDDLALLRDTHYAKKDMELFDRWYGYFKDSIFKYVNYLQHPVAKYK